MLGRLILTSIIQLYTQTHVPHTETENPYRFVRLLPTRIRSLLIITEYNIKCTLQRYLLLFIHLSEMAFIYLLS